jgi:hypothetical protein
LLVNESVRFTLSSPALQEKSLDPSILSGQLLLEGADSLKTQVGGLRLSQFLPQVRSFLFLFWSRAFMASLYLYVINDYSERLAVFF